MTVSINASTVLYIIYTLQIVLNMNEKNRFKCGGKIYSNVELLLYNFIFKYGNKITLTVSITILLYLAHLYINDGYYL